MVKLTLLNFISFIIAFHLNADAQILFGKNNYTSYSIGKLPIVVSIPHDGILRPNQIPDRTCNNPTTVRDVYVYDLAIQLDSALERITGCKPHVIMCHLNRTKLDANRNLVDAACGNPEAETAWKEFHHFIDTAFTLVQDKWTEGGLYIDLHGHGHPIQRLEIGYLLTKDELSSSDSLLNTEELVSKSSIQRLVHRNRNQLSHSSLLSGNFSFGSMMSDVGFPSVPSSQDPSPDTTDYFNGGYNLINHSSINPDIFLDGIQIETNYNNLRNNYLNKKKFGDSLAKVIVEYMQYHYGVDLQNCKLINSSNTIVKLINPFYSITNNNIIQIPELNFDDFNIKIFDIQSHQIPFNILTKNLLQLTIQPASGIYFLQLQSKDQAKTIKLFKN
jgi:hypothetical protein